LEKNGATVEDYTTKDIRTYKEIGPNTKFIIADYTPLTHFKLIVYGDKKQFKIDEVPEVIKAKFSLFQAPPQIVVAAAQDPVLDKTETPAVELDSESKAEPETESIAPVSEPKAPVSEPKAPVSESKASEPERKTYTREELQKMTKKNLEEILKTYPGVSWTTIGKKGVSELIDCILDPEQEKCKSKKQRKGGNYTRRHSRQQG
jgi:hypothetical protein